MNSLNGHFSELMNSNMEGDGSKNHFRFLMEVSSSLLRTDIKWSLKAT